MNDERERMLEAVADWLGHDRMPLLRVIADCEDGDWYLREKILKVIDEETRLDNVRVLKYAYNFCVNGGQVTFIRERRQPTPDIRVLAEGSTLYVEVRKFRMRDGLPSDHPVSKIVDAIRSKKRQLPLGEIGFVAADNFDISLEPRLSHDVLEAALAEIERLAGDDPMNWALSGVVLAAGSMTGSGTIMRGPPHLVWSNPYAERPAPESVLAWMVASLPEGRIFKSRQEPEWEYLNALPVRTIQF
jgi:hypothetical protein